jgi:nitroreductase
MKNESSETIQPFLRGGKQMEVMEAIRSRRSIREYEDTPVPMEDIRLIIEAATWAPSGFNQQPWKFIILQDDRIKIRIYKEVKKKMDEISQWPAAEGKRERVKTLSRGFTVYKEAPVAVAVLCREYVAPIDEIILKQEVSFEERYQLRAAPWLQSVAAAVQNMLLAAASLGYGTCYNTGCLVAREGIQKVLGVTPPWMLVAFVPIGIPKKIPKAPGRKPLDEVIEIR